jgi:glutamyl-tRNA synthetase
LREDPAVVRTKACVAREIVNQTVRTRFAPSPTGYLHIGGARTALFNYLLARRLGGKFILRIEDTDQTRNIREADDKLMEDLRWLGLQWDEGPEVGGPAGAYHQSQRLPIYHAHARRLIDAGHAYYALETRAELDALREAARRAGERGYRYRRPTHFPSHAEADEARAAGRPVVVRLKMPAKDFVVHDQILGDVTIGASELSDFVLLKADGWPTYHFAVVVDDHDMQVTHVLRGQEHLMNTPNHIALQEAFGFPQPVYAHLPIIFNMNGTKMSKREKDRVVRDAAQAAGLSDAQLLELARLADPALLATWRAGDAQLEAEPLERLARALHVALPEIQIHDFRVSGYLPEVLLNFIALLGWSPGEQREKLSLEEMCQLFSLDRIGKTNARFDRDKLLAFNTDGLAAAAPQRRLAGLRDYLSVNPSGLLTELLDAELERLLELNKGLRIYRDIETKCGVLYGPDDAIEFDDDAVKKNLLKGDGAGLKELAAIRARLAELPEWSAPGLDALIRAWCEQRGLGLGKVAQPIRIAVTGTTVSPPIFDTLAILGRDKTLRRIDATVRKYAAGA